MLLTKFIHGAGYAIAAMAVLFVMMMRHPQATTTGCATSCAVDEGDTKHQLLPSRVHAIVLVSKIHKPTLRALAYARATRPSILEALTVDVDPDETKALQAEWDRRDIPVPLKALDSPYREITRPVVDYVKSIRSRQPARPRRGLHPASTSSGTGRSRSCTTRARCGSRAACSSRPGSWSRRCRGSCASSEGCEDRLDGPVVGDVRRGEG